MTNQSHLCESGSLLHIQVPQNLHSQQMQDPSDVSLMQDMFPYVLPDAATGL